MRIKNNMIEYILLAISIGLAVTPMPNDKARYIKWVMVTVLAIISLILQFVDFIKDNHESMIAISSWWNEEISRNPLGIFMALIIILVMAWFFYAQYQSVKKERY